MSNFSTLVAIVAGLKSEWVTKSMRRLWNRVGIYETRMFTDLVKYSTSDNEFKYIKGSIDSMVEAKPSKGPASVGGTDGQSGKSKNSDSKAISLSGCVPFIGKSIWVETSDGVVHHPAGSRCLFIST